MSLSVIVTAAGYSRRMGGGNKLLIKLKDKPIIVWALEVFSRLDFVDSIIVTSNKDSLEVYSKLCAEYNLSKVEAVIEGGKERQDSIFEALKYLRFLDCQYVAVHDGARPLVDEELIDRLYARLLPIQETDVGGIIPGVEVKDTIKVIDDEGRVAETLQRASLRAVQTPQMFVYDVLWQAYVKAYEDHYVGTDDSMLVERLGKNIL
ncbi:2-C-methyl-D-erythritol 4-phosphate cytidylyltransferase, partial [bacterium]|nr:2-C-methyl-D-erythritol 4-phosphate cytidylyltransferase [bacterium]